MHEFCCKNKSNSLSCFYLFQNSAVLIAVNNYSTIIAVNRVVFGDRRAATDNC